MSQQEVSQLPLVQGEVDQDDIRSLASQHSSRSSKSSHVSVSRRERKARLAALEQEYSLVSREAELERQRVANEFEMRQLRLQRETILAKAELAALSDEDENDDPEISFRPTGISHLHVNRNTEIAPTASSLQRRLPMETALMVSKLPKLEMKVFRGDPLDFQQWIMSFEKLIEDATDDPVRRLQYLNQFTEGDANTLVCGHMFGSSPQDYACAKAELKQEFGNPYILARAYISKIEQWPTIKANDGEAMNSLVTFLKKCRGSLPSLRHLQQLNTDLYMQRIIVKLPYAVQASWRKFVCQHEERNEDINFEKLVLFIDKQAKQARHPVYSVDALADIEPKLAVTAENKGRHRVKQVTLKSTSLATDVVEKTPAIAIQSLSSVKANLYCSMCSKTNHELDTCRRFLSKSLDDRRDIVRTKKLCFGCLKPTSRDHNSRSCQQRYTCKTCNKQHPTSLHGSYPVRRLAESSSSAANETEIKTLATAATTVSDETISMSIVMVRLMHASSQGKFQIVYAALDSLSSACFIDEEVWTKLAISGIKTDITVKTLTDEKRVPSFIVEGLCVAPIDGGASITLPRVYTQQQLPIHQNEIPSHAAICKWPHLSKLLSEIPDRDKSVPIGLIIGANCAKALEPHSVVRSVDGGPYAVKTALGWCISGPVNHKSVESTSQCHITCHRVSVTEDAQLKDMITRMYNDEFNELPQGRRCNKCSQVDVTETKTFISPSGLAMSNEDHRFLKLMQQNTKLLDGHYECPLPFRSSTVVMPNNRNQAASRANSIKKRIQRDKKFADDYINFMNDILEKGYAKKVQKVLNSEVDQTVWYLPHHGVYHPRKPNKIRVVFDCSCQFGGKSLNKELMQGPNMTNSLIGVLIRFRQQPIAIMADIESMFYQVRVPDHHQNYLRFVWWPEGDINAELEDYQMQVHLFGGISSPSCANFALRKTADDNEAEYGHRAAEVLRNRFYVDDMLVSEETPDIAIETVKAVRVMCAAGGFRLTKFVSNNRKVLESIPAEDRAKDVKSMDFANEPFPVERALGVHWCVENDKLGFRIMIKDEPLTRRGILSTVSSIYDPLGLASPFLLSGRRLLQRLCANGISWDDPLPDEEALLWEKWKSNLPLLEHVQVERCFKPAGFGEIQSATLHHFSDASYDGYGQCSYLRLESETGKIACSLVAGKSRVVPLKPITVPRLELTAATISAKMSCMLRSELNFEQLNEIYWTDSQIVLNYIRNDVRRFHVFVANRIQLIRESTDIQSWRYVDTTNNPADDASRGLDCSRINTKHRWFTGPEFLWRPEGEWPSYLHHEMNLENDPEAKKPKIVFTTFVNQSQDIVMLLEDRTSNWQRLKKLVAIWLTFKDFIKSKRTLTKVPLDVEVLRRAENEIIKSVQKRAFAPELDRLISRSDSDHLSNRMWKHSVKRCSPLHRLDPFVDNQGILRVGGRLRKSELNDEVKFPVILPKSYHVTSLIARWCHEQVQHSGRGFTLNELRTRGYWIIQGNAFVRSLIYKCVQCRLLRGKVGEQKMADLPEDRCTSAPPFTYCAVDIFGPFTIREGRKDLKRYGCLFTCLACRAIHIETTNSLETDSFINALRRFIARRGEIRELRSDQGTNFVGAEIELNKALQEMNHKEISKCLKQNGADYKHIVWKKNPPYASHMGGVWERPIRTVRNILSAMLKNHGSILNDESFRTLLTEIEAIVNSRPLTAEVLSDSNSPLPLSPINLLTMKSKVIMPPPGCFQQADVYSRRHWRRVQHLANEFWSRWRKEYLMSLQARTKNCKKSRNFQLGDIVLLKDSESFRNDWPMGRIVDVHYDAAKDCVRSVRLRLATRDLQGTRTFRERPIDKLILLLEAEGTLK